MLPTCFPHSPPRSPTYHKCHSFYRGSKYQLYTSLRQCVRHAINYRNPMLIVSFIAPHKYTSHRHRVRHPMNRWNPVLTNFHSPRVMDILLGKLRLTQQKKYYLVAECDQCTALQPSIGVSPGCDRVTDPALHTSAFNIRLLHSAPALHRSIIRTWPVYRSSTAFTIGNAPVLHGGVFSGYGQCTEWSSIAWK